MKHDSQRLRHHLRKNLKNKSYKNHQVVLFEYPSSTINAKGYITVLRRGHVTEYFNEFIYNVYKMLSYHR